MSQPIRGLGRPFCFSDRLKQHRVAVCHGLFHSYSLIQAVSHAKKMRITKWKIFGTSRWIPFGCFSEEVENVSANQRPGRPSWFSDRPDKHKISKRRIKSCFLSSFVEFHSAVSEKSKMSQEVGGQGGHLVFPISPPKNKLGSGQWDFASCQVPLNSVEQFKRRSGKCLSQSEAWAAILFFGSAQTTQTL